MEWSHIMGRGCATHYVASCPIDVEEGDNRTQGALISVYGREYKLQSLQLDAVAFYYPFPISRFQVPVLN
jgi:hypothetical protein